jgi:hypothetical protein
MGRPIMTGPVTVRGRTLAGGAVLGGLLLLALALLGGVGEMPRGSGEPDPERLGPVTAVQPELRDALLTDQDLATAPVPRATADPPAGTPAVVATSAPAAAPPVAEAPEPPATGAGAELCRALFEDPAGLSGLWRSGPWRADPPQETTSRQTTRDGGATLHQLLGVFPDRSVEAYRRLREQAAGCDRLQSTLPDGSPVTVLLGELSGDRRESGYAGGADDGYAMTVMVLGEERTLIGWLSLDRLGPVVSVLRHLVPVDRAGHPAEGAGHPTEGLAETRLAALGKLRPLLAELRGRR